MTTQGDLALLADPVAQDLLQAPLLARLAYTWLDGTPRVVPIWFHWDGREVVLGTPPTAPKVTALTRQPRVALTIDDHQPPYAALLVRGTARVEFVPGVAAEYAAAARRYLGEENGARWVADLSARLAHMARIAIRPTWVAILDFQSRYPSALPA